MGGAGLSGAVLQTTWAVCLASGVRQEAWVSQSYLKEQIPELAFEKSEGLGA